MTLEPLGDVRSRFRNAALERGISPRDVDVLLGDLLGKSLAWLFAHGDDMIDAAPLAALLERRFAGEPLQYIRGKTEFFSREFAVDRRVLIPRPETEILVETAIARAPAGARVLDVGTGSGCIAISIERTRPDLRVCAIDVSIDALALADLNRRRLGSHIHLAACDVLSSIKGKVDLIVSNPPYIGAAEVETLAAEVREFEPRVALTPGPSGTEVIERILEQGSGLLTQNGLVILEIGYGQLDDITRVSRDAGYQIDQVIPDLAAIDRVVVLSRRGSE